VSSWNLYSIKKLLEIFLIVNYRADPYLVKKNRIQTAFLIQVKRKYSEERKKTSLLLTYCLNAILQIKKDENKVVVSSF
jgi:hypothetical protein